MNFFGGDLPGVIQKLPYLSELGVNALYLTPILKLPQTISTTPTITPVSTRISGMRVPWWNWAEGPREGIRIMLDGVFNHCGFFFRQFQDVLKHGEKPLTGIGSTSKVFPVTLDPPNFDGFAIGPYMPKFNTENQEVMEYLLGAVAKWTRTGIDGWRLDVADEVDAHFWREFEKPCAASTLTP